MEEVFYGVYIPPELLEGREEPVPTLYTSIVDVNKVMKEFKGSRFKRFTNEVEAVEFTTSNQPTQDNKVISTPGPGDSCPFKSLKPQELVKFRKAIEAGNIDLMRECTSSNPRYLMTPSDNPAILQEGSRYNALHIAAKFGRAEAATFILQLVKGELTHMMYPEEEVSQNLRRRDHVLDLYLNCAEKGGGDTPLHLAAKFGKLEMVELLTSEPGLSTNTVNKFGEKAIDVVCSRVKVEDTKLAARIRDLIAGMHYIPIYKEYDLDGPSILGDPIPQSDWTINNLNQSGNDYESPGLSSPRTPVTSRTFSINSPSHLQSPQSLKSPLFARSPRHTPGSPICVSSPSNSSGQPLNGSGGLFNQSGLSTSNGTSLGSPLLDSSSLMISAIIGPVNQERAASLYKQFKTCSANKDMSKQRLSDPARGLERQCDGFARKAGSDWKEFWPFLGDYVDLRSEEGLERLEEHLNSLAQQMARHEEEERCREVEEETNDVFLGELELATLRTSRPDHHPLEEMFNNLGVGGEGAVVEANGDGGGVKNGDVPGNHMDEIFDCRHPFGSSSQPLSPVAVLSSKLGLLHIDQGDQGNTDPGHDQENIHLGQIRTRRPSQETKELVDQFSFMFCHALAESEPSLDSDSEIQDWAAGLINYWQTLRRHVNNMRSDPLGRWNGLDYSGLLKRVVEGVISELELEVDKLQLQSIQALLDRLASFKLSQPAPSEIKDASSFREFRRRDSSSQASKDQLRLKELQPLARIIVYYMENRSFPEKESLAKVWDAMSSNAKVSTTRVNKARKFLHSKVFSDSESSDQSRESVSDDFSWVNRSRDSKGSTSCFTKPGDSLKTFADLAASATSAQIPSHDDNLVAGDDDWRQQGEGTVVVGTRPRQRHGSGGSEGSSQYATPPSSPAPSSMVTADEGLVLWMEGLEATQSDRQVYDALKDLDPEHLSSYPNLHAYLLNLRNYKENVMRSWPARQPVSLNRPALAALEPRRLDLNASF